MDTINFLVENKVVILGMLLAMSEVVGLIPSVKSNSIFESIVVVLHKFVPSAPNKTEVIV